MPERAMAAGVAGVPGGPAAVIAHRGASGYLPEHTLAGKALAHGMGADYLEQDVVASRDGELIVFHDLYLDDLTDVRARFPGRARGDGRHYCVDFDLAEIRSLRVRERRQPGTDVAKYPKRFPVAGGSFPIATFSEELAFISGLNAACGRVAGIYPEIKEPDWHRAHGIDLSTRLLETLAGSGYAGPADAVFVQCFDPAELRRVRHELRSSLRLIQLLEGGGDAPDERALQTIAEYADGIGPSLGLIYRGVDGGRPILTDLVRRAHRAGLAVHPYTFRQDALPPGISTFDALLTLFIDELHVDGVFTDFPDLVVRHLKQTRAG